MPSGKTRREDAPPRAGQSLHDEYAARHRQWIAQRRRAAALSATWWVPALAVLCFIVGETTHFGMFGALVFVLATVAVCDVMFRRPDSLVRVRVRADAEQDTGKVLEVARIRGGEIALHDRMFVAGSEDSFEVEHLVMSVRGVFLIDSKQWSGRKIQFIGGELYIDQIDQAPMFKEFVEHAQAIGAALTAAGTHDENVGVVTVNPMLVVHSGTVVGTPRTHHGVIILTPPQLAGTLRAPAHRWTIETVRLMAEAAEVMLLRKGGR
ncbi:MAG TPA: nuclease-related domain-containing protein [Actinocrinis sp.]|jgi:hypothetical protein